jgi:hypothetical protein
VLHGVLETTSDSDHAQQLAKYTDFQEALLNCAVELVTLAWHAQDMPFPAATTQLRRLHKCAADVWRHCWRAVCRSLVPDTASTASRDGDLESTSSGTGLRTQRCASHDHAGVCPDAAFLVHVYRTQGTQGRQAPAMQVQVPGSVGGCRPFPRAPGARQRAADPAGGTAVPVHDAHAHY